MDARLQKSRIYADYARRRERGSYALSKITPRSCSGGHESLWAVAGAGSSRSLTGANRAPARARLEITHYGGKETSEGKSHRVRFDRNTCQRLFDRYCSRGVLARLSARAFEHRLCGGSREGVPCAWPR